MLAPALLIIIGEPLEEGHLQLILDRILEGLSVWDKEKTSIDLNTELLNFINNDVTPDVTENSGTILRSEGKIYVETLISPTISLFAQSLQNFFLLPSPFKLIIHAGPAYQGTGSWLLRDGTFSFHDFGRFLYRSELVQALNSGGDTSVIISCITEGEWSDAGLKAHEISKRFAISIQQKGSHGDLECASNVTSYFSRYVRFSPLLENMPSSTMVGSIRFRLPTIYIFPAGQGDAALFGISGFTLLLDGGFPHRTCYWDFLSHVDRIDAYLVSRVTPMAANGVNSFLKRLALKECHPKLVHCFMNAPARVQQTAAGGGPASSAPAQTTQRHPLLISVFDQAFDTIESLAKLSLEPHPLALSINPATKRLEPITIYQKVGHGRLDMFVLNPVKDSKELSEFTSHWKKCLMVRSSSAFTLRPGASGAYPIPLQTQTSMAVLIVWHPANEREYITRILYPGSCPQDRLFAGLDKLKYLDFLRYRVCTPAFLNQAGKKGVNLGLPVHNASSRKSVDISAINAAKFKTPQAPTVLAKLESEAKAELSAVTSPVAPTPGTDLLTDTSAPESQSVSMGPSPMLSPNPVSAGAAAPSVIPPLNNNALTKSSEEIIEQQQNSPQAQHEEPKREEEASKVAADVVETTLNGHANLDDAVAEAGLVLDDSPSREEYDFTSSPPRTDQVDLATPLKPSTLEMETKGPDAHPFSTSPGLNPDAPVFIPRQAGTESPVDFTTASSASSFMGGAGSGGAHPEDPPVLSGDNESRDKKTLDQLKNEWGQPLGLPPPPPPHPVSNPAASKTAASTAPKKTSTNPNGQQQTSKNGPAGAGDPNSTYVFKARPAPKKATGAAPAVPKPAAPKTNASTASSSTAAAKKTTTASTASRQTATAPKVSSAKPLAKPTSPTKPLLMTAKLTPSATPKTTPSSSAAKKYGGTSSTPPFYVDLTYVPHCGNPHFVNADFFKNIRAKYYVVSAVQPPKETLEALLIGKKAWNMPDEEVTLIPTYDSETLNLWMALHRDELAAESLDVAPSCVRCSLNLEDHQGAVCAAYRLEL